MENLNELGLVEMRQSEMNEVDGGMFLSFNWGAFFRGAGVGATGAGAYYALT
ncbi:hypothetical protein [Reichenbachiella sp. 5M10]|uniref:hypothetical protein n=1 Tax=Reichenbachiella sp. 5M10 TaxID=1889772 RepID=UPI0013047504|nr:hypothetical protein [Reichenbachiella sp. 5M10]